MTLLNVNDTDQNMIINVDETEAEATKKSAAPKIVFVVPYRDREHHLKFFKLCERIPKK